MCMGESSRKDQAIEAIHIVGGARAISACSGELASSSDEGTGTHTIENKYYRADVPIRTYEHLDSVPSVSGALLLLLEEETVPSFFEEIKSWWSARNADEHLAVDVDVPLVVAWGIRSGTRHMDDVFEWSVDEGFELVYVNDHESGEHQESMASASAMTMARENIGMDRVREALQHCRWSMAEMKERGASVQGGLEVASEEPRRDTEDVRIEGPNWREMNEDVLRAFEQLAACGTDSDDSEGEDVFEKLAAMLRRHTPS